MKDFVEAAVPKGQTAAQKKKAEKPAIEFKHHGRPVKFFYPGTGQLAMIVLMKDQADDPEQFDPSRLGTMMQLFLGMADKPTADYFGARFLDGQDELSDLSAPGSMFDVLMGLIEEWGAAPTKPSRASSAPRRATGRTSTATSSGKG